jgi:PAS domain-containing protein
MSLIYEEDFGAESFLYSPSMQMLSGPNGEIYAANEAFCNWIGYSEFEFTRSDNPVTWFDITDKDGDFEADKQNAEGIVSGKITSYKIRKHYIPKGQRPKLVELMVNRFPHDRSREFKFFIVDIVELSNGRLEAISELMEFSRRQTKAMEDISQSMDTYSRGNILSFVKWSIENKMVAAPIWLILAFLLFGRSIIEIIQMFFNNS